MNRIDETVTVLSSGLSLLGLAYLYFWLYRDYRRDLLRTRIFIARAELFDRAAEGRIAFDHPAYGLLRSTLNGFLRYGHRVGAFRLIMTAWLLDPKEMEELYRFRSQWDNAVKRLNPEDRAWLEKLRNQTHQAFFEHLLATTGGCYLFMLLWLRIVEAQKQQRRSTKPLSRTDGVILLSPPASFSYRLDSVAFAKAATA